MGDIFQNERVDNDYIKKDDTLVAYWIFDNLIDN